MASILTQTDSNPLVHDRQPMNQGVSLVALCLAFLAAAIVTVGPGALNPPPEASDAAWASELHG
jgi:hypothetical protein